MGNTQALPTNKTTNGLSSGNGDVKDIVERINKLSQALYQMYGMNFNNDRFCQQVALTYEKKLGQLSIYQLTNVTKNLEQSSPTNGNSQKDLKKLDAFITYQPKPDQKFIVNELKDNLVDFFTDKKVNFQVIDEIDTSVPDVTYINPKVLGFLKSRSQQGGQNASNEINRLLGNLKNNKQNNNQNNNQPLTLPASSILSTPSESSPFKKNRRNNRSKKFDKPGFDKPGFDKPRFDKPRFDKPRFNKPRFNKPINNKPRFNKPKTYLNELAEVQDLIKTNNKTPNLNKSVNRNKTTNLNKSSNLNKGTNLNKATNLNKGANRNKSPHSAQNIQEINRSIQNEFKELKKQEKDVLQQLNKREKSLENINLPANEKIPSQSSQLSPRNTLVNVNQKLSCRPGDKDCYLTKQEMCRKIAQHYVLRGNIIASILSAIPRMKDNELVGSFCYSRYQALKDGKLCLPPGINELENLSLNDKLKQLNQFVNHLGDFQCKNVNGYYKVLNPKEKTALVTNDNRFNRFYVLYTAKLYRQYLSSLQQLLNVLQVLENTNTLNNAQLNQIAEQTKNILDEMYSLCQFNYLSALLSYLRADLDIGQKDKKATDKEVAELTKGLEV